MTVEPTTVFVTLFALAAATAFRGGRASAITHAAIVRTRLATGQKVAELGAADWKPRLGAGLAEGPPERLHEGIARVGRTGDELDRAALQLEHLLAEERQCLLADVRRTVGVRRIDRVGNLGDLEALRLLRADGRRRQVHLDRELQLTPAVDVHERPGDGPGDGDDLLLLRRLHLRGRPDVPGGNGERRGAGDRCQRLSHADRKATVSEKEVRKA